MIPQKIILHHSLTQDSETVSWGAIRKYHINECGWRDIGYHFGIELLRDDYEILIGRFAEEVGAHTKGENYDSIGICFVGAYDIDPPPDIMWKKGLRLVRFLCYTYNIATDKIFGHRKFAPYKSCPGRAFDLNKFRREI